MSTSPDSVPRPSPPACFAEVFSATKRDLGQKVALKILGVEWYDNVAVREQFIEQARSIARLKHPRVVDVLDLGEEKGRMYMALEFLAEGDLRTWLSKFKKKAPPLLQIAIIVEDIAAALDFIHKQEQNGEPVVHGDVKPGNILLERDPHSPERLRAKLSDLGMLYAMQKAAT